MISSKVARPGPVKHRSNKEKECCAMQQDCSHGGGGGALLNLPCLLRQVVHGKEWQKPFKGNLKRGFGFQSQAVSELKVAHATSTFLVVHGLALETKAACCEEPRSGVHGFKFMLGLLGIAKTACYEEPGCGMHCFKLLVGGLTLQGPPVQRRFGPSCEVKNSLKEQ